MTGLLPDRFPCAQDRAELLGGSCAGGMVGTVGVNRTRGVLVDISFAGGISIFFLFQFMPEEH